MLNRVLCLFLLIAVSYQMCSQKKLRLDSDNDGVVDIIDVDDDNDGILDVLEDYIKKQPISQWRGRINVESSFNNLIFKRGGQGWSNSVNSVPFSKLGFSNNYKVQFNVKASDNAIVGFGIKETGVYYQDVDYGFLFDEDTFKIFVNGKEATIKYYFKKNDLFEIVYKNDKLEFFQNKILIKRFDVGFNLDFYLDTSFRGASYNYRDRDKGRDSDKNKDRGNNYCDYWGDTISIFSNFEISSEDNLDMDNDGLINSLDLDSDGDGCNDVLEAGYVDKDNDGVLGNGVPVVDKKGKVKRSGGYTKIKNDILDPKIKICPDENIYGVYVNTQNLPSSLYNIVVGNTRIPDLTSGSQSSEVFVGLGKNNGEEKIIFINVNPTQDLLELNLRFTITNMTISLVQVLDKGSWLSLSPEFFRLESGKISFVNIDQSLVMPFTVNLINGIQYDKTQPFVISIDKNIDLTGATLEIIAPQKTELVNPNTINNNFTWDGTSTLPGTYKFILKIQNKSFKGHFLVL